LLNNSKKRKRGCLESYNSGVFKLCVPLCVLCVPLWFNFLLLHEISRGGLKGMHKGAQRTFETVSFLKDHQ